MLLFASEHVKKKEVAAHIFFRCLPMWCTFYVRFLVMSPELAGWLEQWCQTGIVENQLCIGQLR